jgi:hypothetical protein
MWRVQQILTGFPVILIKLIKSEIFGIARKVDGARKVALFLSGKR